MPIHTRPAVSRTRRWAVEHGRLRLISIGCRLSGWPRRLVAAALLLAAAGLAARARASPSAQALGPAIWVAAHDLPAGSAVTPNDVRAVHWPDSSAPQGVLSPAAPLPHTRLATPVRAGEPLTDLRFLGPSLAQAVAGSDAVIAPVRLADADAAAVLHPGDQIDVLLASNAAAAPAEVAASDARVLTAPQPAGEDPLDGALIMVATTPAAARVIAGAPAGARFTATVRSP
jgi:Flp pilus assembly protein CpaB